MKRILLFAVTNLLVVVAISFVIDLLGLRPYLTANGIDYQALLIFCALFGFGGAFISLQISRWSAKTAMGVRLIDLENPSNQLERRLADTVKSLCQRMELETLPEIGIYRSPEVNAFATGPSRSRALLAVSTGLLENMDSRAVEGVLGPGAANNSTRGGDLVTTVAFGIPSANASVSSLRVNPIANPVIAPLNRSRRAAWRTGSESMSNQPMRFAPNAFTI